MNSSRNVLLVFSAVLVVRLLLLCLMKPWDPAVERALVITGDAVSFQELAINICSGKGFGIQRETWKPQYYRTPGYPGFMAAVYCAAGVRPWLVLVLQSVISAAAGVAFFLLLYGWLGSRAAVAGVFLYALEPALAVFAVTLYSDSLFVALLIFAMYAWYSAGTGTGAARQASLALLAGGLLGAAALVRPQGLLLPLFFGVPLLLHRGLCKQRSAWLLALLLAGSALPTGAWYARNYLLTGKMFFSTAGEHSLLVLTVARVESEKEGVPFVVKQQQLLHEANTAMAADGIDTSAAGDDARAPFWRATARRYLAADPGGYARAAARGIWYQFTNLGMREMKRMYGPTTVLEPGIPREYGTVQRVRAFFHKSTTAELLVLAVLLLLHAVAAASLVAGFRPVLVAEHSFMALVSAGTFLYLLSTIGIAGSFRLKLPLLPFYMPVMAAGAAVLCSRARALYFRFRGRGAGNVA